MLNGVEWKCWINIIHQNGQTCSTCCIQQCWTVLKGNVESTSFNRMAKRVQHVVFNNVERCWMDMLNQHHSTEWPNVFNMLYSTMLNSVEGKCWINIIQQGGQTRLTGWIKQYWTVFNGNVESTSFNKEAKRVQQVKKSTMLNGVEQKCRIRLPKALHIQSTSDIAAGIWWVL